MADKVNKKQALVLGYHGYASAIIPEYQTRMVSSNMRPKNLSTLMSDKPDAILFTGGEDISPALYGELDIASYGHGWARDSWELEWYRWALVNEVPMIGICRGMQLFTALTGGKLIQHVTGHSNGIHRAIVTDDTIVGPREVMVNSIHHQMCVPKEGTYKLLAYAPSIGMKYVTSTKVRDEFDKHFKVDSIYKEPEALWFPEIKALGVQFHPEGLAVGSPGLSFFKQAMAKYIMQGQVNG